MKKNDLKKLPAQTIAELRQQMQKIQQELVDLRMQKALNKNKNVREYKLKRQDLARINTIIIEKQLSEPQNTITKTDSRVDKQNQSKS